MIKMAEYAERRKALMGKISPESLVILPSAQEMLRNGDAFYPFRQQSDFYYLTGFEEPEAVAVIAPNRQEGEYILFNRVRDPDREIWDGPRAGQEGACRNFLADQSFPIEALENKLAELLIGREAIHYPMGVNRHFDNVLMTSLNSVRARIRHGLQLPLAFVDIAPSLHEMRLFKSDEEISVIQQAVDISHQGHVKAMQVCKPGMNEYQLEAEMLHQFFSQGAKYCAYNSIIGAGKNTCVLHYISNNQPISDGDLVLIDAGAEYQNYAADITRTFPANGRFSAEQRAIYELVLASQLAAIQAAKPGALWTDMQTIIVRILTQGLVDLGILKGQVDELIEKRAYYPFYMHNSGHWLGLDVHDVGRYRLADAWRPLAPGMVLTVEPGLYISQDLPGVDKRWHNIGVRIEDDIVITNKGCDVLSKRVPKTVDEIEAVMAS